MAPLPPSNTPRYKAFYTVNGEQHVMDIRSSQSPAAFGSSLNGFLLILAPELFQVTLNEVHFAATGSNVFNPVVTGFEGNVYSTGTGAFEQKAWFVNFIGRSTGGRRVRLMVFGIRTMATDFRFLPGENATIDLAINALDDPTNVWECIDGLQPVWKQYANAGVNAYWQRNLRP